MSRQFYLLHRRPTFIDILTPFVYGTREYRFAWGTNFDASFTQIVAASPTGFLDAAVPQSVLEMHSGNQVRVVIDLTNAAYSIPSASAPIWLQFSRYDGSSVTYTSPPTLLLPYESNRGRGIVTIQGTAPAGATVADSLQIDLPCEMTDIRVQNEGGNPLFLATTPGGAEIKYTNGVAGTFLSASAPQSSFLVRGNTAFSMSMTRALVR